MEVPRRPRNEPRRRRRGVKPPNPPWIPLNEGRSGRAGLAFYHSDSHSNVPVREVTRVQDSKADPNLETLTFGLFTTCERGMRAGVVREGIQHIFFCTRRGNIRVLTGYYKIGWYCKGPPIRGYSTHSNPLDDFALAASEARFVNPGFPLRD